MTKILTEEELNVIESDFNQLLKGKAITHRDHGQVEDLIVSHRSLLSANAELSFKNNELQKKFDKSLEWLETIETEFYHNTEVELERCRTQAKCAREELK